MRRWFHVVCVALVWGAAMIALTRNAGADPEGEVVPGDNLVVEGIPRIPVSLAERVARYSEFRYASFSSWHPLRREMIINTRFGDTDQAHLVKLPGGARTQLTFSPEGVSGASFQPTTGDSFIFSVDAGGNEAYQIYRHDLTSGEATLLTDGKSRNTGVRWSNRGDWIAYGSTRRNGQDVDIHVVKPSDPRTDRMAAQLEGGGWSVTDWSPDDRRLLVREAVSANLSRIWLLDVTSGEKTLLTPGGGSEEIFYGAARFDAGGRGAYVTTDRDSEFQRLAHLSFTGGRHRFLSDRIRWDVEEFERSNDGKLIAFVTNEGGISRLHVMEVGTRRELKLPSLPTGVLGGIQWRAGGRDLGFTLSSARSTSDAYSLDLKTGTIDRWTASETGGLDPEKFSEPELVSWPSFDGKVISGFLSMPPARFAGKRPVIINIHGGPEAQARPGFLGRNNFFLNELGVAVLYPNVRGSSGYGKTLLKLDNGFLREGSYRDIGALLDWIQTRPDLDASRIMVTGGSYGGHMSLAVATLYSEKIRAALPVVGMSNLVTFLERTEAYRRDLRRVEYGDERDPKMREFLLSIAPLNNASKITVPMFIVQGGNDPRVPLSEATQMVEKIRNNGRPVWYLMAKDEGHGFAKKKNQNFQFYATVLFVEEYLLK